MTLLLFGCVTLKNEPLDKLNFKDNKWQMVYIEDKSPDNGKFEMNIWLLNDNNTIDSLKKEYKCALDKQTDGEEEYQVYLFKNRSYYAWNIFGDKKNISIGKLKSKLVPVNTTYTYCPNWNSTKTLTDSLTKQGIVFTISPADTIYKRIDEFAYKLTFNINKGSKLFHNSETGLLDWLPAAKREIERLYPELIIKDISFNGTTVMDESNAPGDYKGHPSNGGLLKAILTNNKAFKLETSRLKNTDLFSNYNVCTLYTVTTYEQKKNIR